MKHRQRQEQMRCTVEAKGGRSDPESAYMTRTSNTIMRSKRTIRSILTKTFDRLRARNNPSVRRDSVRKREGRQKILSWLIDKLPQEPRWGLAWFQTRKYLLSSICMLSRLQSSERARKTRRVRLSSSRLLCRAWCCAFWTHPPTMYSEIATTSRNLEFEV